MEEYKCKCGSKITWGIYNYSMRAFGKPLCVACQKKERIQQNPKLGKFINDQLDKKYGKDFSA
jgi:hypothetical protein